MPDRDCAEAPVWDLTDLYRSADDPALAADCAESLARARRFEERFRGRIAADGCDAALLREALDEYDRIHRGAARPVCFASLLFAADTTDPAHGALLQKMQLEHTGISRHLIFFDLEIGRIPEATYAKLAGDPALAQYRHYLEHERRIARHHLTEPEEKLAAELGNTGVRAFRRLFSEITSRARFRVQVEGETRELNQSETLALLFDPCREVRLAASAGLTETLREQAHVLTFIYNNLLLEKATLDRLRGYDYPEQARHEGNELPLEVVDRMVEACVRSYPVPAEYYRLKKRLLGLESLSHVDRYAPISQSSLEIPFARAREIVLEAFASFSPRMRELAESFFTRGWIDAQVRPGKRGGAFCSYIGPDLHPFVFMNYTGRPRDVMTLAHELGHALHGILAEGNNYLNYSPSLPLAETASVFAEILVFEKLQAEISDPAEKLSLLAAKIEDTLSTVHRQASMYRFEQAAHCRRRERGELTTGDYSALWQESMQAMFGDSLELGEEHAWWWLYIPHIFSTPFYVYAYSFGELLVLGLYARYRRDGEPFVQRYFDLLAAGGSRTPTELLAAMEIDIADPAFWEGGCRLIEEMVEQAKQLADRIEAA